MLAGPETRPERNFEQVGEVALRELGANISAVACLLDMYVDNHMAREGVAQIIEAHPAAVARFETLWCKNAVPRGELWEDRNLADGGARLWLDTVRGGRRGGRA